METYSGGIQPLDYIDSHSLLSLQDTSTYENGAKRRSPKYVCFYCPKYNCLESSENVDKEETSSQGSHESFEYRVSDHKLSRNSQRSHLGNNKRRFRRLASMPGDVELREYIERLRERPDKLTTPHNKDTCETILHLLAKEGKIDIITSLCEDVHMEKVLLEALFQQDKLGWSPIMAAVKADNGTGPFIMEQFLLFLKASLSSSESSFSSYHLIHGVNIRQDSLFSLLVRHGETYYTSRKLFFELLHSCKSSESSLPHIIVKLLQQLSKSSVLDSFSMKDLIEHSEFISISFLEVFQVYNSLGNNILMELAQENKDEALRELLTHSSTSHFITHSLLNTKNSLGQTLLTIIEVNREFLSESLPLLLKKEYGCHRRDLIRTEICLSRQLETSASALEIITELHQLEPKSCIRILLIWTSLFLTSLLPNISLALGDILSDAYLVFEYYSNMRNSTMMETHQRFCQSLKTQSPLRLQAFASCLNSTSKFSYSITFLLVPLAFYLTEFLTLSSSYEPTGLKKSLESQISKFKRSRSALAFCQILGLLSLLLLVLLLWVPVTAFIKFIRDAKYQTDSEGQSRLERRKEKRVADLSASRGELIEVSLESVFEPMVQSYIIFPSLFDIVSRLYGSISFSQEEEESILKVDFKLKGIETAQLFSILISLVSLAWCYSEYNSVRKNSCLDISVSPVSRFLMFIYMLFQVVARLLSFVLFTLFWGPGNFYPLMIFISCHLVLGALLHVFFSEDITYYHSGRYLKFFHNVSLNAFASIYFHNYIRFDEMPIKESRDGSSSTDNKLETQSRRLDEEMSGKTAFVDSQRPGVHISTLLRQLSFDVLYTLEFILLLSFGFSSDVQDLNSSYSLLILVVFLLTALSLCLRLFYYSCLHVWSNVILSGKKLIFQNDFNSFNIQSPFFKIVFISRNTWIYGSLLHIETTLCFLPKRIFDALKGRSKDLEENLHDVNKLRVFSSLSSLRNITESLNCNKCLLTLLLIPICLLFIGINVLLIFLLLCLLLLSIPIAVLVFLYNIKSGFRAVSALDEEESQNTLELPPEDNEQDQFVFSGYPSLSVANFRQSLEETGTLNMSKMTQMTVEECNVISMFVLSLNRKKYPLLTLICSNCELTDDKLIKLLPLIIKFERVILNGSQRLSVVGWKALETSLFPPFKLRTLECKMSKNDDDVVRFRREMLYEELKGSSSLSGEAFRQIALLVPKLEKVYLDDIFSDSNFLDLIKNRRVMENMIQSWEMLASQILSNPWQRLHLLSLPGCSINDDIMNVSSIAFVRIKCIHLGRNNISSEGWSHLVKEWKKAQYLKEVQLTHLSLNSIISSSNQNFNGKYVTDRGLSHLNEILVELEELDLSGQHEISYEGWESLCSTLSRNQDASQYLYDRSCCVNLKTLIVSNCKIKAESRELIENRVKELNLESLKVQFGEVKDQKPFSFFSWCA